MTKLRRLLFSAATAAAVLLGAAAPAAADAPSPQPGSDTEEHCYVIIETSYQRCFADFAGVTSAISGGKVVVQSPSQLTKATARQIGQAAATVPRVISRAAPAAPVTVLGVVFADVGYTGWSKQFVTSGGDCSQDISYHYNQMPAGWNDRVSSFESMSRCRITLYEIENLSGRHFGPEDRASIGSQYLNDRASSIAFDL